MRHLNTSGTAEGSKLHYDEEMTEHLQNISPARSEVHEWASVWMHEDDFLGLPFIDGVLSLAGETIRGVRTDEDMHIELDPLDGQRGRDAWAVAMCREDGGLEAIDEEDETTLTKRLHRVAQAVKQTLNVSMDTKLTVRTRWRQHAQVWITVVMVVDYPEWLNVETQYNIQKVIAAPNKVSVRMEGRDYVLCTFTEAERATNTAEEGRAARRHQHDVDTQGLRICITGLANDVIGADVVASFLHNGINFMDDPPKVGMYPSKISSSQQIAFATMQDSDTAIRAIRMGDLIVIGLRHLDGIHCLEQSASQ